jgi:hypothetical protein
MGEQHDGGGDASRHQHVEIRELPADVEERLRQQGEDGPVRMALAGPAADEGIQGDGAETGPEERRGAGRPGVGPEQRHRGGRDPVEQRRLVQEGQAVHGRHQPVARAQHLPGDADIAAFVGQQQRPRPRRRGDPDEDDRRDAEERLAVCPARCRTRKDTRFGALSDRPVDGDRLRMSVHADHRRLAGMTRSLSAHPLIET